MTSSMSTIPSPGPSFPSAASPSVLRGPLLPHRETGRLNTDDVAFMTIREQADLIQSKKLSPVELTRTYLERIEKYDPQLHAFNLVLADDAMAEAKQAEQEIAAGNYRGPMHGIPVGVKDQFNIKGPPEHGRLRRLRRQHRQ